MVRACLGRASIAERGRSVVAASSSNVAASAWCLISGGRLTRTWRRCPACPRSPGLRMSDDSLRGIVITHGHPDHYGLVGAIAPSVPIYIGAAASRVLKEASFFSSAGIELQPHGFLSDRRPFSVGPFELTPYLVDHSAFDAYALHVAAAGRTLFYSGTCEHTVGRLLCSSGSSTLHLEGTRIHERNDLERGLASERDVEEQALDVFRRASGPCSPSTRHRISIDSSLSTARRSAQAGCSCSTSTRPRSPRPLGETIPQASWDGVRVFVPQSQRVRVKETREFDRVAAVRSSRIYRNSSATSARAWSSPAVARCWRARTLRVSMVLKRFGRCGRATSRSHQASNSEAPRAACDPADDCSRVRPCHCRGSQAPGYRASTPARRANPYRHTGEVRRAV